MGKNYVVEMGAVRIKGEEARVGGGIHQARGEDEGSGSSREGGKGGCEVPGVRWKTTNLCMRTAWRGTIRLASCVGERERGSEEEHEEQENDIEREKKGKKIRKMEIKKENGRQEIEIKGNIKKEMAEALRRNTSRERR